MTITHHPSDVTLSAFASATLDEARGAVVAVHLSLCPQCRRAMRAFEHVAGRLLEDIAPEPLSAGAAERTLSRLDQPAAAAETAAAATTDPEVPAPLPGRALGPWRRIGLGVQWRPVQIHSDEGVRLFLLKAAPGTRLPRHRHTGTEWTCVIQGAFRHQHGRYGAGDFDEADETVEHSPVVEDGEACVCVVALQGNLQLESWLGRLIQPFIRL